METCPVVKVKSENDEGYMLINESDYDKDVHTIFDDGENKPKSKKADKQ